MKAVLRDFVENLKEDGELAVLRFKVKEGAAAGKTAVTLTSEAGDAFNVNFVDVPLALENGVPFVDLYFLSFE